MKKIRAKALFSGVLLVSLVVTLGAFGCGGGDDESAETQPKAQYIKQADAICTKAEKQQIAVVQKINKESGGAPSDEVAVIRRAGLPPLRAQVEELEALAAPATDAEAAEQYLAAFDEALQKSEDDPTLLLNLVQSNPFEKAEAAARKFGFKVCSGP